MKTYTQIYQGQIYQYYYDTYIKLWTIYEVDKFGYQISEEADHAPRKSALLLSYPFLTFKTNFECQEKKTEKVDLKICVNKFK
jgi:hypothetical protein